MDDIQRYGVINSVPSDKQLYFRHSEKVLVNGVTLMQLSKCVETLPYGIWQSKTFQLDDEQDVRLMVGFNSLEWSRGPNVQAKPWVKLQVRRTGWGSRWWKWRSRWTLECAAPIWTVFELHAQTSGDPAYLATLRSSGFDRGIVMNTDCVGALFRELEADLRVRAQAILQEEWNLNGPRVVSDRQAA